MKRIKTGATLNLGMYAHASAYDSIENHVDYYELTEEEAEETCFFGFGECECYTCTLPEGYCKNYFYVNENGEIEF